MAEKTNFFHADDGIIASTNLLWLQWSFDVLIGLFERFVLQTNMARTVEMVCQPGKISGRQSTDEYRQHITEKGDSHHVR